MDDKAYVILDDSTLQRIALSDPMGGLARQLKEVREQRRVLSAQVQSFVAELHAGLPPVDLVQADTGVPKIQSLLEAGLAAEQELSDLRNLSIGRNVTITMGVYQASLPAAEKASKLAEEQLQAELGKFERGTSTIRWVLEQQTATAQALVDGTRTIVDSIKEVAAYTDFSVRDLIRESFAKRVSEARAAQLRDSVCVTG